jgi:hypothetical protein
MDILERLYATPEDGTPPELIDDVIAEIIRLRAALAGLLEFPGGQYSECEGFEEAWDEAKAALQPSQDTGE